MSGALDHRFEPVIALQSLQELLNVRNRRGFASTDSTAYVEWLGASIRVIGHEPEDMKMLLALLTSNPALGASDAMIWASAIREEVDLLVTRDRPFGEAVGDAWVDPMNPDSLTGLLGGQ